MHTKKKMFMRIKYGLILLFLSSFSLLFAQKDPMFTLYPWAQSFYNPAAMGEKELHLNFTGILRQVDIGFKVEKNKDDTEGSSNQKPQYEKFKGQQILLNIDSYIKQIKGAVSITFLKDKNLYNDNIGFNFGYAAKIPVRGGKLGIGLQFGFLNQKPPKKDKFNPIQNPDPTIEDLDKSDSFLDFDINFGLHYKAPTWYVGLSCNQILGGVRVSGEKKHFPPVRNLYAMGGYIWNLKTPVPWSIEPSLIIQSDFSTWSMGIMALARYNGIIWFGSSYQLNNGIAVLFGAVPFYNSTNPYLKGIEIGLAYTFQTKKYSWQSGGGSWGDFEILIRYGFNFFKEKPLTGYGSSRHLYKNQY